MDESMAQKSRRLQKAIAIAVDNHPGLVGKAFVKTLGRWHVRDDADMQVYESLEEEMLAGILVEIYTRCTSHGMRSALSGERIWVGAALAADLFDRQQAVLSTLMTTSPEASNENAGI